MLEIKVYDGQEKIQELRLESKVVSIGRDKESTLVLPDVSVSRRHAQIEPNGNFYLLRDNGSTNGTFVNEMLARAQVLSHGDAIRIGKYVLRVEDVREKTHETTRVRVEALRLPGRRSRGATASASISFEGEASLADASRERLLRLYEIQREIGYIDKTAALLERALEIILDELDADRGAVLLQEADRRPGGAPGPPLRPVAVRSKPEFLRSQGADGEIVIPQDLLHEATHRAHGARRPTGSFRDDDSGISRIAAPLRERRRLRGVVYLERSLKRGAFSGADLQFLNAIAAQAAISLANAELFNEVSLEKEKVQAILGSLTDGILVANEEFRVVEANAATAILLELQGSVAPGMSLFDLFAGFALSPDESVLKGASLRETTLFHLSRSASETPGKPETMIAGKILPFPRGAEHPQGVLVVLRDRTETMRVEQMKTRFLGDIAHKLRTPLTVIEGNLPFLRDAPGEAHPPGEILDEIERNSRSLCHLIDQFIEYTDLEVRSLRQPSALEPLTPRDLVKDAVRSVAPEAERRGVLIVEKVAEDLPLVAGRRERLVRALRQVLENAVKFCEGRGQVLVQAAALQDHLRIDLVDDGPGIPPSEVEAVFNAFHQVDKERTGQVPGAGLGLSIARHIVQEHGGEVEIVSPYRFADRGTRVSIRLPTARSAEERPAAPEEGSSLTAADAPETRHAGGDAGD